MNKKIEKLFIGIGIGLFSVLIGWAGFLGLVAILVLFTLAIKTIFRF